MTTKTPTVRFVRLPHGADIDLPKYETGMAAGMDLRAACPADEPIVLSPGARALVPLGLIMELPVGFEGQIRPRSGLALKHGLTCLNTPGTIDADYRGELMVLLVNLGQEDFSIERNMRVAQLVIAPVVQAEVVEATLASKTDRGKGGFGSTGV